MVGGEMVTLGRPEVRSQNSRIRFRFSRIPFLRILRHYWTGQRVPITSRGHVACVVATSGHGVGRRGAGRCTGSFAYDLRDKCKKFVEKGLIDTV